VRHPGTFRCFSLARSFTCTNARAKTNESHLQALIEATSLADASRLLKLLSLVIPSSALFFLLLQVFAQSLPSQSLIPALPTMIES